MESLAKFIKRAESTQYQRKYKRISIFFVLLVLTLR